MIGNGNIMPPSGQVDSTDLETIRGWIEDLGSDEEEPAEPAASLSILIVSGDNSAINIYQTARRSIKEVVDKAGHDVHFAALTCGK